MRKLFKKAFTLVELLVVIAILGVLATISIVGYSSYTKRANLQADTILVSEWNHLLAAEENINNIDNINDVKELFTNNNTSSSTFIPKSNNYYFYWNEDTNRVYLVNNNNFNAYYPEETITEDKSYRLDETYYKITYKLDNCSCNDSKKFLKEGKIELTFSVNGDYSLPENISIIGKKTYTANEDYTWENSTLTIQNLSEDITIEIIASKNCFAKGTKITMADNSTKNIEDINSKDLVLTFNHEKGIYEAQEVFFVFHEEYKLNPFTLYFSDNNTISIVGEHDLFNKETLKYVSISEDNVNELIGKHFYNATNNEYVELINVVYETTPVDFYTIYTKYNVNCIANDMLTVPTENEDILNIYEINIDLTIDKDQLEIDINKYGLFEYPTDAFYPIEYYEVFQMKYVNVMVGKGLIEYDEIFDRIEAGLSIDNI